VFLDSKVIYVRVAVAHGLSFPCVVLPAGEQRRNTTLSPQGLSYAATQPATP
jgi:hypothetical protein